MNNEHNFLLINIVDEENLIEMMKRVENYINSQILVSGINNSDSPYGIPDFVRQHMREEYERIKQLKTRTMDFLKQGRIIGITGNMTPNKHFYGITIHGGRVDLMGVYNLKDDNCYNHFKYPDTKLIFEEIIKIKDGTDFKEFLEDNKFSKIYDVDFLQLYKSISSIIFNNFYRCGGQEKIFKFVKHHKIIYAQRISNNNIFCINIYGFIIISDDNTLYDVDKILIYSKEETLTTEYFHKYIKEQDRTIQYKRQSGTYYKEGFMEDDIYNKYINVGIKSGDNIFVLEQKLKEKKEQEEKEEEKNSYKKLIDDLIKEVTDKLDNYNEEMLQYFIKKVSSKDKYIELYKYYIEEVLNYKNFAEKLKKDILFQFIDDIYNEKYTNGNRDLRFDIRYNVNLPNGQQRIDIIFGDLLERNKLMSYYNGIKSKEIYLESFNVKEKIEKIFVSLLSNIRSYLYNRGGCKKQALMCILENLSNIKKTILNFDIDESEFKEKSRKIVSKICDYNKLINMGITNPYFVFNKED